MTSLIDASLMVLQTKPNYKISCVKYYSPYT